MEFEQHLARKLAVAGGDDPSSERKSSVLADTDQKLAPKPAYELARRIDELEMHGRRAMMNRLMLARQQLATAGGAGSKPWKPPQGSRKGLFGHQTPAVEDRRSGRPARHIPVTAAGNRCCNPAG